MVYKIYVKFFTDGFKKTLKPTRYSWNWGKSGVNNGNLQMQSKIKLLLKRSEGTGYYNDWLNIVLTKDFVLNTLQLMIKLEFSQILKEKYLNNTERKESWDIYIALQNQKLSRIVTLTIFFRFVLK